MPKRNCRTSLSLSFPAGNTKPKTRRTCRTALVVAYQMEPAKKPASISAAVGL